MLSCKPLNDNPGAGTYYKGVRGVDGPSFGFSKDARVKNYQSINPGPGHYKIPTKIWDTAKFNLAKNEFSYV